MNELSAIQKLGLNLSLDEICYCPPYRESDILFCAEVAVVSQESLSAGIQGIKAERSLVVDAESFIAAGEIDRVKYKDVVYAIYRTYPMTNGDLQLYLTQKKGIQ